MKPDWKDAPEWAKHLTQDLDGDWFWHDRQPTFDGEYWSSGRNAECRYAGTSGFLPHIEGRPND